LQRSCLKAAKFGAAAVLLVAAAPGGVMVPTRISRAIVAAASSRLMLIKKTSASSMTAKIMVNNGKAIMANSIAAAPRVFRANLSKPIKRQARINGLVMMYSGRGTPRVPL
jgi:hypothetical protein